MCHLHEYDYILTKLEKRMEAIGGTVAYRAIIVAQMEVLQKETQELIANLTAPAPLSRGYGSIA